MKLGKNSIVAITFVVTFVILLLFSLLTSGFRVDIKGIFVAVYFAVWIAAVIFVLLTFIVPFVQEKMKESKGKVKTAGKGGAAATAPIPFKSPRSNLPVRERIASYVAERRKEDGLSAPEPLRPSRTGASKAAARPSSSGSVKAAVVSPPSAPASGDLAPSGSDDLGGIPLPDDFGSLGESHGEMGGLPGLEGDFDDLGGFGSDDDLSSGFRSESPGLADELPEEPAIPAALPSSDDLSDGGLPAFDGNIEPDFGESDLMPDDGMMDLSGDDILTIDDSDASSSSEPPGDNSMAGLPDFDGNLEPDILDSDLSGDDDLGDIEFMDLEPEEPKKKK
jgi:uncharacterized membrane protein